jgi:serine/threonine protein kinase
MADNPRRRGRSRPESPRVFGGRWQVVKELGSGGQGTAFLVRDVNGENADAQYVLKQLRIRRPGERHEWQQKRLDRFEREIAALRRLDLSPNIPSVVDSYVGSKGAYFVTPYAGKNLEKMRNLVEPQAILQQFRGLVEAAKFANDREVVHRDIKPNNATVNGDGTPCLVDFGICMYDDEVGLTDTWGGFGTRYFAAPECEEIRNPLVHLPTFTVSARFFIGWRRAEERWAERTLTKWRSCSRIGLHASTFQ